MKDGEHKRVPLDQIDPRDDQVRKTFTGIKELAADILLHGLLQNLVVEPSRERYTILAGERRFRALKLLQAQGTRPFGWNDWSVPVSIRLPVRLETEWIGLSENLQRSDVYPWELGKKLDTLSQDVSLDELSKQVGHSKAWILARIKIYRGLHANTIAQIRKLGVAKFTPTDLSRLAMIVDDIGQPDEEHQARWISKHLDLKADPEHQDRKRTTADISQRRLKQLAELPIPTRHTALVHHLLDWLTGKAKHLRLEEF